VREQKAIAAFAEVWLWRDLIDVMRRYRAVVARQRTLD
jgi:hypothetical protein